MYQEKSGEVFEIDLPPSWKEHVKIGAGTEAALAKGHRLNKTVLSRSKELLLKATGYLKALQASTLKI